MGDSSSIAPLAVKLFASMIAVIVVPFSMAAADEEGDSPKEVTKGEVSKPASKKAMRRYSRLKADVGITMWTENVQMTSPAGESIPVVSSTTGVMVGGDWKRGTANSGFVYQLSAMYGQLTSESKSSIVVYQKGRDKVMGLNGGVGFYFRIPTSRAEISVLAQGRMRKVDHTVPEGYSFGNDSLIIAGFGEVDLSLPLTKSITIFQQFSAPLHDKRLLSAWVIGLRL